MSKANLSPQYTELGVTHEELRRYIRDAQESLSIFKSMITSDRGIALLRGYQPDWAKKILRRTSVKNAVVEKMGSNMFAKRRPDTLEPFNGYVERQLNTGKPLSLRVDFGPLKNAQRYGDAQDPDLAEYLAFAQLARYVSALSALYPYGIRVDVVPDNKRACAANLCRKEYIQRYISGLNEMVTNMGLNGFITIEPGQESLYSCYNVDAFVNEAQKYLEQQSAHSPETFCSVWQKAFYNAGRNLVLSEDVDAQKETEAAAWRYLVQCRAELLSGMWSPTDALPIRYGNHANSFQIYTMGRNITKLPWQISLPPSLIEDHATWFKLAA